MTESELAEAEKVLGHVIDRSNAKAFSNLNALPDWLVADLSVLVRERGRLPAIQYLKYHCTDRFGYFANFLQDVVEGGAEPADWRLDRAASRSTTG